ncbi:UDP-2,3-diacylglucosamine diphosphatase [Ramlibacter tataouinensis]|uniref:UDP-2,3-diacylglucosamine hydrolase n=1 Tax=Ramlibacter tataouinensis (strain ATCC BAA-407 / DSM 14655 / LMG 21543 / TTB310) TaxID=365046 RepID=F5Y4X1_RAMTT|nr:UDP-2,3-diacylglucosamine diphosphatase [Ramlibacter tataouinensis]AEG92627.1 Candidate UDP-2,3-diacylglucosamine hydrolase [Ramlibacter tataouinensis TTB310]
MGSETPCFTHLAAAPGWRAVDFISDLHLQAGEPATFEAWRRYMASTPADAVFILGDLFEVWIGDDAAEGPGFAADCEAVLREAAARRPVFLMHGNRDFLVGEGLARRTGTRLIGDPTVLAFAGRRWLLTHGDMLCLADTKYLAFRAQVRTPQWARDFLAQPLAQRQEVARRLREGSQAQQREVAEYADVDAAAAREWLRAAGAQVMIHGHTHRPGEHGLGDGLRRVVLSDWDAASQPPRLQALRLEAGQGLHRVILAGA